MKNIFTPPQIQFSGTNNRIKWISDQMRPFIERPILLLIIPWIVYPLLDISTTIYLELDSKGIPFAVITTIMGFLASCIYFFWLLPAIFYLKNSFKIVLMGLLAITILSTVKYFLFHFWAITQLEPLVFAGYEFLRQWTFFLITLTFWGFYALIKALQEKRKTEVKLDALSIAHKNARLSPHFTLNLIGGISTKAYSSSPELVEDLDHFITILRYAYISPEKFNSLSREIETILSYIHGQKIRFSESLHLQNEMDLELLEYEELYMPKMLIVSLVENIFKHGDFQDATNPVLIKAKMIEKGNGLRVFTFSTRNKILKGLNLAKSGFGIETIRNLLDYYFPNSELITSTHAEIYTLNLTIPYAGIYQNWPDR